MKNECSIVRDILPLYAEKMVSKDTAEFVKGHLENCPVCCAELEKLREPVEVQAEPQTDIDAAPLKRLKKALLMKKVRTILCTAAVLLALAVGHLFSDRAEILCLFAGAGDRDKNRRRPYRPLFRRKDNKLYPPKNHYR